jgi:hypothetical protein
MLLGAAPFSREASMTHTLELVRRYLRKRRFWRLVEVREPALCWGWKGSVGTDGRPEFEGRPACEHAYELARGALPAGARIERRCRDIRCVNPHHLELIRPAE